MHQRKSKKILIYFFLLLFVGSINNTNINNLKFINIKNISVDGLGSEDNQIIFKKITNLNLNNIFLLNKKNLIKEIESSSLIEKYSIFKRYPSTLNININKAKFLARISKNGKIYYLGSNGKLILNSNLDNQIPFVFGNPEIIEFFEIKKIIDGSEINFGDIKNLYFYLSQRWDLELKNNIIIKLPTDNVKDSLEIASKFLHHKDSKDVKIIDLRIKNQIILND